MRRLNFAVDGTCRLRGGLWRLTPWRRRREAASFEALCRAERFAALREYPRLAGDIEAEVRPHYELYTARFNAAWMAISLELSVFLLALCRLLRPRRLVDLGSGFSSALLRRHQREATPTPEVWSVDLSPKWLEMTRQVLCWQGLSTDHLATWRDFAAQAPGGFDLVVHDLGSVLTRRRTLRRVLDLTARGGVVVIDDANYGGVRRHAARMLRRRGIEHHLVGGATRDRYGRYALLAAL
jgi:predicted O-methyltransferase YrrM